LKTIKNTDFYREEMVAELSNNKLVYISSESALNNLMNYYRQYQLAVTGQEGHTFMYGLPIRKSLKSTMKTKLTKM